MPSTLSKEQNAKKVGKLEPAASTKAGYSVSIQIYNDFAAHNSFPQWEKLSAAWLMETCVDEEGESLNVHDLFFRLSKFMTLPVSQENKHYKPGSAGQYLSNFKSALSKRFPVVPQLQSAWNGDSWYHILFRLVRHESASKAMKRGDILSDASDSIWKTVLEEICLFHMKEGTSTGYMWRCVMIIFYMAIGRASEAMTMTWDTCNFNTSLECLESKWMELKTGKISPMSFFADAESFKACAVHALFCYLVSDGGNSFAFKSGTVPADGAKCVFPHFYDAKSGQIAGKITSNLHGIAKTGEVAGLTLAHSSQGLKHGAADDCTYNQFCNMVSIMSRANWDYSGQVRKDILNSVFIYNLILTNREKRACCFDMSCGVCILPLQAKLSQDGQIRVRRCSHPR